MDSLLSPRRRLVLQGLSAAVVAAGCGQPARAATQFGGPTMGSTYTVKIAGLHLDAATEAALALMHVLGFRHLLVIDGARVFGLVSMRDLVFQIVRRGEGRFEAAVRAAAGSAP